jgi:outer membrane protein TolC
MLLQQVLARNPSLAQMVAAWQASSARFPQVTSLEDPMFGTTVAPASIGSRDVEFGYRVEISQRYPFPGKLPLRGANALAEASAAGHDIADMRLQLVESTQHAFAEYYLVGRALTVNAEALSLLNEFRQNAETRYRTGLVSEQDVLQADVEIGRQRQRQLTLERMRQVAIARLNTLMHLPPDSPLPSPPQEIGRGEALPDAAALRAGALARRPDVQALAERIKAEQAALALAEKEFCPDFEVTAAYDTIMGNGPTRDLAAQVGVRVNLPVRKARRHAAVAEAQARIAQRQAELARQIDQVNFQVQEAYAQARESERVVRLYEETILRAARGNIQAAQSAYVTGKIPFLSLIEAERNLVDLRDRYYEAVADYVRRRATLERVGGGPLVPLPPAAGQQSPNPRLGIP